jgi:hypothetical protein
MMQHSCAAMTCNINITMSQNKSHGALLAFLFVLATGGQTAFAGNPIPESATPAIIASTIPVVFKINPG